VERIKKDYIEQWFRKADEDIAVLEKLLSDQPEHYTGAICFHAQQAVEKFLKIFLIYHDVEFRKVHDVDYLLDECKKINIEKFDWIDLKSLTDYAVSVRYPDDFICPSLDDANYYSEIAYAIRILIYNLIEIE